MEGSFSKSLDVFIPRLRWQKAQDPGLPNAASAILAQVYVMSQPEAKVSRGTALTLKELVIDHVHTTLEPEDWQWQPPLKGALEGLTAAQAAWKPTPERHSIWQIVRHLLLWKRGVLEAWNGNPPDPEQLSASDWQLVAGSEADWEKDRRTLLEISTQFLTRAQALDDAGLSKQIVWYKGGATQPLAVRVVRTTTHDVYHAGQIMYLRALQGVPSRRKP